MKIAMIFARLKPRRGPDQRVEDPNASWTAREWADLPVHHPRTK